MIPIMESCSDPQYKRIIVVCGAQMGKTEALFNVIGHRLDDDPVPTLYIGPTQKQVESISSDRVMKLFKSVPSLWSKLKKGKRNKLSEKFISGVRLGFGWAGSATELSSHPAGLVLVDERDRMDDDVAGEGDPVALAEARTATFPDGKVIITSTPTIENASAIWTLYDEGTQLKWAWPCPDCDEYFVPKLSLLQWPDKCSSQQALKQARLACPECGSLIGDEKKSRMNALGRFVTDNFGEIPESDTTSFWVSGLCSPWRTFGQRAKTFIEAIRSGVPGRVQAVINTGFGELYKMSGEAPDWERVADLREPYGFGTVPEGVRLITAGVDVQGDRLVYVIRGWGVNFESWLIDHGELWGETEHDFVWEQLAGLLTTKFDNTPISKMMVDSGFKPGGARMSINQVYEFCRRFNGLALPTKGHDVQPKPLRASKIDVSVRGRIIKNGIQLWHLDSDYFKSWVHARIEWPQGESGAFHLASNTTDDYCQQVVAEQKLVKPSGKTVWIKTRKDNHYLDCEALNVACAHVLQVHTLRPEKDLTETKTVKSKRKRGSFVNSWR